MKKGHKLVVMGSFLMLGMAGCGADQPATASKPTENEVATKESPVQRGKYLVTIQDCNGCHTPWIDGKPDMTRMLSGHPENNKVGGMPNLPKGWVGQSDDHTAWAGPWGVSFAANLTPDSSGFGEAWTEEVFMNAIRSGKHMGTSRGILPAMPWEMQANMTDDDLKAVYAYLRTIPPVKNKVQDPIEPK